MVASVGPETSADAKESGMERVNAVVTGLSRRSSFGRRTTGSGYASLPLVEVRARSPVVAAISISSRGRMGASREVGDGLSLFDVPTRQTAPSGTSARRNDPGRYDPVVASQSRESGIERTTRPSEWSRSATRYRGDSPKPMGRSVGDHFFGGRREGRVGSTSSSSSRGSGGGSARRGRAAFA